MLKTYNLKLALLSLSTSIFLVGVAHAESVHNECNEEADVCIFAPNVHKAACGAEAKPLTYRVVNNRDPGITLLDVEISPNHLDSFPDKDLVTYSKERSTCQIGKAIGYECSIVLELNTTSIDCPVREWTQIDRTLEIDINTWARDFYSEIDLNITTLGAAEDFSVLAPSVFNTASQDATVAFNVGYTDEHGFGTQLIRYYDQHRLYGPFEELTIAANEDTEATFYAMLNKQYDGGCHNNNTLSPSLGHKGLVPQVSAGVFCFRDPSPVTINGDFILNGDGDYVFIIDYGSADHLKQVFYIFENANILLRNGAQADRVYWIVRGATEQSAGSFIAGNVLSTGAFEFEDGRATAGLQGRILVLGRDEHTEQTNPRMDAFTVDCESERAYVCLYGNTISNPYL